MIQMSFSLLSKKYQLSQVYLMVKTIKADVAMRVIADHLRAIVFAIADGQLPSNNKAGYVIRRILRRAVRYGYTFLNLKQPFISELVPLLFKQMSSVFHEIKKQQDLIRKVIAEEEFAFLRTLENGIKKFEEFITFPKFQNLEKLNVIDGNFAFELFDTYGFPVDLTQLMAKEIGWQVDMEGFNKSMLQQKTRSREAAEVDTNDWVVIKPGIEETQFVGYDTFEAEAQIVKYRKIKAKSNEYYQIVLDSTPFYAESGGQVGDRGYFESQVSSLKSEVSKIIIDDTKKENNLIVHIAKSIPADLNAPMKAVVDYKKRILTMNNHSATHLMNAALKQVLGNHIEQKGSLVDEDHLRFDFSHFSKMTKEEIAKVEAIVNAKIRENIQLNIQQNVPLQKAFKELGAVGVFGEKYGEFVRVITFDKNFSIELCGGTHVPATGQIGLFKITSESAIAAGIRRIEAITADKAEEYINNQLELVEVAKTLLKNPKDMLKGLTSLIEENAALQKQVEELKKVKIDIIKNELLAKAEFINDVKFIAAKVDLDTVSVKDLAFNLNKSSSDLFIIIANESDGRANLTIMISENLVKEKNFNATNLIKELAKEIQGGGGGQPHFATSGGKNPAGIPSALSKAREIVNSKLKL